MVDSVDMAILQCLQKNSRRQWKDIGEEVHLTGQAVAARIRKMEDEGIIKGFTVALDTLKLGKPVVALITIFMKSSDHAAFQRFIASREEIVEAHRISGDGCYWMKANVSTQRELNQLLDEILKYANYKLFLSVGEIK